MANEALLRNLVLRGFTLAMREAYDYDPPRKRGDEEETADVVAKKAERLRVRRYLTRAVSTIIDYVYPPQKVNGGTKKRKLAEEKVKPAAVTAVDDEEDVEMAGAFLSVHLPSPLSSLTLSPNADARSLGAESRFEGEEEEDDLSGLGLAPARGRKGSVASPEMAEAAKNREANKVSTAVEESVKNFKAELATWAEAIAPIRSEAAECSNELAETFKLTGDKVELGQAIFERTVEALNQLTSKFGEDGELVYENAEALVVVK